MYACMYVYYDSLDETNITHRLVNQELDFWTQHSEETEGLTSTS